MMINVGMKILRKQMGSVPFARERGTLSKALKAPRMTGANISPLPGLMKAGNRTKASLPKVFPGIMAAAAVPRTKPTLGPGMAGLAGLFRPKGIRRLGK